MLPRYSVTALLGYCTSGGGGAWPTGAPDRGASALCGKETSRHAVAVEATYATTNLATFKAIVKKYTRMPRETILRDLVASQAGNEGKWFAAAKDAGFFELAIELANRSPSDPRTLIRAARDFAAERPEFALAAGMSALRGIAKGWGYDITGVDVLDAYAAVMAAAGAAGVDETVVKAEVRALVAASRGGGEFVGNVLGRQLGP